MNKAEKAKVLAADLRKAEPGIAMAFLAIAAMILAVSIVAVTIYGLMLVMRPAGPIGPLGDPGKRAPTHSAAPPAAANAHALASTGGSFTGSR